MANYSLPQIATFLTTEKLALHGISPEVYDQNWTIAQRLGDIAANAGEGILAVQLFGSRAAGYSNLQSDIDINIIATDERAQRRGEQAIIAQMKECMPGVEADNVACMIARIDDPVPASPSKFIEWVMDNEELHGIFDEGLARSDALRLTQLAALEAIDAYADPYKRQPMYERMRQDHAGVFLGNLTRIQRNLAERLGEPLHVVEELITQAVYQKRQQAFGLPPQFTTKHEQLSAWASDRTESLKDLPAYDLYRTVRGAKN